MKFDILVPSTLEESLKIDNDNNNALWREAIDKEKNTLLLHFNCLKMERDHLQDQLKFLIIYVWR